MARELFLLGGVAALDAFTPPWLEVCGERIAVLSHAQSERHAALYRELWPERQVEFVAPAGDGTLDLDSAAAVISGASALFVAGGETARYQELYSTGPLRDLLRTRYRAGVPYAGLSAGALLAMEHCLIPGEDSAGGADHFLPGLGLLPGTLLGVHFAERGGAAALHRHLRERHVATGWGLDDGVTLHFCDEDHPVSYGGPAFLMRL
ncbi:Type 1 glutamine amidotransferase-like domain-containing protein [Deinococcus sp. Marseille-Q6407]|uniref:Type 1 glutamine amidotransferase-like domain-containing protein n=1 Tax=Deinococcus sp. Marseille-Q6407 TaxID=2969223 RepID=UPI0021C01335|nr:Type 1 glutamine amidotransferase-like domain-containing protein [Deinococcus sp. Marseille-Q6407]